MAQDYKIGVGMAQPHATGVFIHGHIQDPMEALGPPVTAASCQHLMGSPGQAAEVVAGFHGDFVADPAFCPDLRDVAQAFLLVAL